MKSAIENNLILFLFIPVVAILFGLDYGVSNQNTYLIHGLTLIDPGFLANDWFAHGTYHYHDQFSKVILLINYLGLPIPTSIVVIAVILRIIALTAIYKITCLISGKHSSTSFILILFLILFGKTSSVADSYIFSSILQPSSFGSAFLLCSILLFLRGQFLASGLCMAFSGLMHTNYLVLNIAFFGIAHLFLGMDRIAKRFLSQFLATTIVLALRIPFIIEMMSSDSGARATYIFQFIRSPHHYVSSTFLFDFTQLLGWALLGLAGLMLLVADRPIKKRIISIYCALLIIMTTAAFLTTAIFIPLVSKLFFWRLAPFFVLISQTIFLSALVATSLSSVKYPPADSIKALPPILLGACFIYWWHWHNIPFPSPRFLALLGFTVLLVLLAMQKNLTSKLTYTPPSKSIIKNLSIAALSVIIIYNLNNHFRTHMTLVTGLADETENELYQWVKTINKTATFLVPIDLENFRLHGKRAIIADWKSTPIDPDGVIEWYARMQDITGIKEINSYEEAKDGYLNIDRKRLAFLKNKYTIDYAVLYRKTGTDFGSKLPVVFQNKRFSVIELKQL